MICNTNKHLYLIITNVCQKVDYLTFALVMICLVLKYGTVLLDLLKVFYRITKLLNDPVILKSRLEQSTLWDCFGNAIASFIGYYYEVALKTGSE